MTEQAKSSTWDVVVYGGVPCGIAAACIAARAGARVLLIETTQHVGGLSTSGVNTAESEHMLKWTIGGFALEFYRQLGQHYGTNQPEFYFESGVAEAVYERMVREAGVTVSRGAALRSIAKSGARITAITLTDGRTIAAHTFIDASYEGDLMAKAGVSYVIGREAKAEFGEEAAGIRFDPQPIRARTVDASGNLLPGISTWAEGLAEGDAHPAVMNYNFRLIVTEDPAKRVPIPKPKRYDRARFALLAGWLGDLVGQGRDVTLYDVVDLYKRRNGKFEMNNKQAAVVSLGHFGGQFGWPDADDARRQEIYDDHLDYTLGLLHFLATDAAVPPAVRAKMQSIGLHRDEFADNGHMPYRLYIREARRMRGAYVVTQQDVQDDRRKEDSVGISSHFIDCHHVQRVALSENEFVNEGRIWRMGWAYQIPYRALTPRAEQCDNLLVPGAASFSHVAFCSLRLESVWMIAGHAAGQAAAMAAAAADTTVQSVDIPALQDALRRQDQVVDFQPGALEKCEHLNGPPEF